MTQIVAVHPVLAGYRYSQEELTTAIASRCGLDPTARRLLARLHESSGVRTRHLALPLERYAEMSGFGAANDAFVDAALELAETAARQALATAELRPEDVDVVLSTTVTGLAVPALDARLANRVGLRSDVRRLPLFGLGCVGGAAGLARAHDLLGERETGLLLSLELCSLTWQPGDASTANLVASALFGDGGAAVVLRGNGRGVAEADDPPGRSSSAEPERPVVVATRSVLYPDTERVMGWDITDTGFRVVLGADVPDVVRANLGRDVERFLTDQGLSADRITRWICHPGGPKVLDAVGDALGLADGELALTRDSLTRIGNLSSASVLHVLADTLRLRPSAPGTYGLLLAMGPGFCSELVLLRF